MEINFDIEMIDHDEMQDATRVRISTTETNQTLAFATVIPTADDDITVRFDKTLTLETLAQRKVSDAILTELRQHQEANPQIETLRDLFMVCTPSGSSDHHHMFTPLADAA